MKNLSSLSKANRFNIATVAMLIMGLAYMTYIDGFQLYAFLLSIVNITFAILIYINIQKARTYTADIMHVFEEVSRGNFEIRKIGITEGGRLGKLGWNVNDFLDQLEVFVREVNTSIDYAAQNKFFRTINTNGLNEGFVLTAKKINTAIDAMQATHLAQEERNFAGELGKTSKPLAVSFEAIQTQLADGVSMLNETAIKTKETTRASDENLQQSEEVIGKLLNLSEYINNNSTAVDSLTQRTDEISQVITLIKDIAD